MDWLKNRLFEVSTWRGMGALVVTLGEGDDEAVIGSATYVAETAADGVREAEGQPNAAGFAFKLLADELVPWATVKRLEADPRARNLYRFKLPDGTYKFVAWGAGTYTVPAGITRCTSVVPAADGSFAWKPVAPGDSIPLALNPVLLK